MSELIQGDKMLAIWDMKEGDTFLLTDGKTGQFQEAKRTKFTGMMNGQLYNIPFGLFEKVVKKVDPAIKLEKRKKQIELMKSLKPDDWFYVVDHHKAEAYRFLSYDGKYIYAINPVTKGQTKIDSLFEIAKIE